MADERYIQIEKYENEFRKLVESNFDLKLERMSTSASSILNGPISFKARFPTKNRRLKGSDYYYSNNTIIHFTSFKVLLSIINDGALRLYNLHNSNDEKEYSYASQTLENIYKMQNFNESNLNSFIDKIKEYSFILSCTSHDSLNKSNFWEKYGDGNKGVAIEFEIINNSEDWEYFYISKVHYDKLKVFEKLKKEWEDLQTKNPHLSYQISLDQFLSLHKSKSWSEENEIRILTIFPDIHKEPFKERIYNDFKPTKPTYKIKYFKLPLCDKTGKYIEKSINDRSEFFWSLIPKLRISNIYFGPDFPMNEGLRKFQEELKYYIATKMNCWIENLPNNKMKIK